MTTASWTTGIAHTDDATFRAWGSELAGYLATVGLVKTADTGQINWTTVTRPGTSTDAGYELYYLNDSMHATQGLYIKITYGTGSATTRPRLKVQVGEGSDGAGALTGQLSNEYQPMYASATLGASTYVSYAVATTGLLGVCWKVGASASGLALAGFVVGRSVDSTGAPTAEGAFVIMSNAGAATTSYFQGQCIRFDATAKTYDSAGSGTSDGPNFFLMPQTETSSDVSGTTQAMPGFGVFPSIRPLRGVGVALLGELTAGSTCSVALVGSTAHTYIQWGQYFGRLGARTNGTDDSNVGMLVEWE